MQVFKKEKNNTKIEYAKKYLLKYIKELKVHFNLNDNEVKKALFDIYYKKTVFYNLLKKIKNTLRIKNEDRKIYSKWICFK